MSCSGCGRQWSAMYRARASVLAVLSQRLRYGQTVTWDESDVCIVSGRCFVTGKEHSIRVKVPELVAWLQDRGLIQHVMPSTTEDQREFLMSGTSPEGWAQTFPPEDEEDPADV